MVSIALTLAGLALTPPHPAAQAQAAVTAIVGGTVVDGNGGPPIADAVVLIDGARITAVGPRSAVPIPPTRARSTRAAAGCFPA